MDAETILNELQFKAVRSSGPGGQHVNKTASKVILSFHLNASNGLSDSEKERLLSKLKSRISADGFLNLQSSATRSQHKNKAKVIQRFLRLIEDTLKSPKQRKRTKPSKASVEKRLQTKKANALKKANRKPPTF